MYKQSVWLISLKIEPRVYLWLRWAVLEQFWNHAWVCSSQISPSQVGGTIFLVYVIVVYKLKKKKNHTAIGTINYKIYLCTSSDKIDFELILYMLIFQETTSTQLHIQHSSQPWLYFTAQWLAA